MARSSTKQQAHTWPVITVELDALGGGVVTVAGVTTRVAGTDVDDARVAALGVLVGTASRLGRPVLATTSAPDGQFEIVVHQDGTVEDATPARRHSRSVRRAQAEQPASPITVALTDWEGAGRGEVEVPPTGRLTPSPRPPFHTEPVQPEAHPDDEQSIPLEAEGSPAQQPGPGTPAVKARARRVRLAAIGVAITVAILASAGGLWTLRESQERGAALEAASRRAIASQRVALDEQRWVVHRQFAGRVAAGAAIGAQQSAAARAEIARSSEVLAATAGQVDDELTRQQLGAAINAAAAALDNDSARAAWRRLVEEMVTRTAAVEASWQAQQMKTEAAAAATVVQPPASSRALAQTAPAAQPAPAEQAPPAGKPASAAGDLSTIRAVLSSGVGTASFTVTVTSNGAVATSVAVTVGGHQVAMAGPATVDGSATYTGSAAGLPAGIQQWTAAAGGLSTSGQIEVF